MNLFLSAQFNYIDQFLEHIKVLMDVDTVQLEAGPICITSQILMLGDIVISRYSSNKALFERYCFPPGYTLFGFSRAADYARGICCGIEVPPDCLGIFHPNQEYCFSSPAEFDLVEVKVADSLLEKYGVSKNSNWIQSKRVEQAGFPLSERGIRFRDLLFNLFDDQQLLKKNQQEEVWTHFFREWLFEEFIVNLLQCLETEETGFRLRRKVRYELFRDAVSLIDSNLRKSLSTRVVAEKLGCTSRGLQYAFQEHTRTTPTQFILNRKLHAARNELLSKGTVGKNVSNIALRYNIHHFGRFSMYYTNLFSESPSETMKQLGRP